MDFKWMDEPVERVRKNNWIYRCMCFLMRRKLTFKELYFILERLNEPHLGKGESERMSWEEILRVYETQNGRLPEEVVEYEDK